MTDVTSDQHRHRLSVAAVNLGLASNVVLAGFKTVIGILGHSPALLADGVNSTSDVAYYIVVRVFMRLARKPPDREHPYGHTQMESIAALVVGAFVITTGVAIFWDAVNGAYDILAQGRSENGAAAAAMWVALLTVAVKVVLTVVTRRLGRLTNNAAVIALAYDHRNDIFSASGATLGIFLGRAGHPWADPAAGAVVSLLVLATGIRILRDSSADLMDTVPGQKLGQQVRALVKAIPEVKSVEELRAHRFGPYFVLNMTIGVDGLLSVAEGDRIASLVEQLLCERVEFVRWVYVHYHPAGAARDAQTE
jgi:cation diffusion facilitator family transporter